MQQDEINKNLDHYMSERKKSKPFWSKVFDKNKNQNTQKNNHADLEDADIESKTEITPEQKMELEKIEGQIEEVGKVEEQMEEELEQEREGLLKKFFNKLNLSGKKSQDGDAEEAMESAPDAEEASIDPDVKEMLKNLHGWITQLPPEKLHEFKSSKDFESYTKVLKKYGLIK